MILMSMSPGPRFMGESGLEAGGKTVQYEKASN